MNVRGPRGTVLVRVRTGFDGDKAVTSEPIRPQNAVALEIWVDGSGIPVGRMIVSTSRVRLPHLHLDIRSGIPANRIPDQ